MDSSRAFNDSVSECCLRPLRPSYSAALNQKTGMTVLSPSAIAAFAQAFKAKLSCSLRSRLNQNILAN